ncbi:hypothetical protein MHK_009487 [Candidatus Magnetomorum sp. HK-1]|nr:hypothetical protein MHK_009487 [Candidatus Magnetomorum sp. HK-1]
MELIKQKSLIEQADLHAVRNYRLLFGMIVLYFVTIIPLIVLYVGEVRSRQSNEIEIIYVNPTGDFVRIEQGDINHIQAIRYIIKKYITMQRTVTKDYQYSMQQVWNSRYLLTQNALQCLMEDSYNPDPQINKNSETKRLWIQGVKVDVLNITIMATETDYRYLVQWIENHSKDEKSKKIKKQGYFKMVKITPSAKTINNGNLTEWSIDYYSIDNEGGI